MYGAKKSLSTSAKCSRCGIKVWSFGDGADVEKACAEKLHAQCPRGELNTYVLQSASRPIGA